VPRDREAPPGSGASTETSYQAGRPGGSLRDALPHGQRDLLVTVEHDDRTLADVEHLPRRSRDALAFRKLHLFLVPDHDRLLDAALSNDVDEVERVCRV